VRGAYLGLCIAALAACDDAVAIEVVVPPDMAADEVDLFIPLDPCKIAVAEDMFVECDFLLGDNGIKLDAADEIFALDTMLSQEANGPGSYEFRLEPGSRDFIPLLIAVSKENGAPTGAVVFAGFNLDDGPQRRRAELGRATDFTAFEQFTGPPGQVHVWSATRADDSISNCVEVNTQPRIAIVDRKDPDCDGFVDRTTDGTGVECDPLEWNSTRSLESGFTCAQQLDPNQTCHLGGSTCTDGQQRSECDPTAICVAAEICACEPGDMQTCFDTFRNTNPLSSAHVACVIAGTTADGSNEPFSPCLPAEKGVVDVDLGDLFVAGNCQGQIRFAPPSASNSIEFFNYESSLRIAVPNATSALDLQLGNRVLPCSFPMLWDAIDVPLSVGTHFTSTMAIEVTDSPSGHVILLPVDITIDSCAATARGLCKFTGNNISSVTSVTNCTR
jgi:hypothetical protein